MMDKVKVHKRKQKLFKFLHHSNSKWSHVYHSVVATVFCTHSIMITFCVASSANSQDKYCKQTSTILLHATNSNDSSIDYNGDSLAFSNSTAPLNNFDITINAIFAGFLFVELVLRLWSSTYIHFYNRPNLKGLFIYFNAYLYRRLLDLLGIFVYLIFIIAHSLRFEENYIDIITTFQILQIYQANRILFSYVRTIWSTLFGHQQQYLTFTLVLALMVMILSSIAIFLAERSNPNTKIRNILDSFWFIYQTFTTIGYGDVVPKNWISKVLVCFLSAFGVFTFDLPACIIGTSLSIKMHEDYRKTLKYRKAVRLIQTIWRCRIINMVLNNKMNSSLLWRSLAQQTARSLNKQNDNTKDKTVHDLYCISYIWKIKYKMARYRFMRHNMNMSSYSDVSQQYAEIWQRIDYIENDLSTLSDEVAKSDERLAPLRAAIKILQDELDLRYRPTIN